MVKRNSGNTTIEALGIVLGILGLILLIVFTIISIVRGISFDINCTGHLKRAADANTVELAQQELQVAISNLEQENMTNGYTSVLYRTPDEDIGFWYKNLKSSLEELKKVKPDSTPLEKSNLLIKLRETLLDKNGGTETVTAPDGISRYPYNLALGLGMLFASLLIIIGFLLIVI